MYPTTHLQHIVPPSNHRSMNYNPAQNGAERRQPPNTASPKAMEPNNQPVIPKIPSIPKIPVQTRPFGDVVIDSGRSIIRGLKIPCIETTTPHRTLRIRANLAEAYPDASYRRICCSFNPNTDSLSRAGGNPEKNRARLPLSLDGRGLEPAPGLNRG